jgi:hypothetical protein
MTYPKKPSLLSVFEIMYSLFKPSLQGNILVYKHYTVLNFTNEYLLGMIINKKNKIN